MNEKRAVSPDKWALILSAIALVFLTTPAWIPGFCGAAVFAALLTFGIWKWVPAEGLLRRLRAKPWYTVLGLLITSGYGCNFRNMWIDSSYVARIAGILGCGTGALVAVLAVVMTLASAIAVIFVVTYAVEAVREDYTRSKNVSEPKTRRISLGWAMCILSIVYILGISAILRANFLYQDDAGRAAWGYKQWDYFGRFLSTAMATFVHMGDYLADAAPLPQLLSMVMMAAASVAVLYVVYRRTEFSVWEILAVVPLGLNPYFLECVSFRFDAPYMAASVLGGVLPLLFCGRHTAVYILASMLGVLAVCTSYQAATGIFPILVILLALRMWNRGQTLKDTVLFCLKSVAGYGLGLVYFKLVLMRPADAGYVSNAMPSGANLISNTMDNLARYYSLVASDFKPFWLGLLLLIVMGFLVMSVCTSKRKPLPAAGMTILALVLMLLLCFGIYPVLANTLFAPRAMYGFGVLIALLCITVAEGDGRIAGKVPVLVLSWAFFVFSFIYGNALNYQREYTDFRMNLVIEDLNDMDLFLSDQPVTVQLSGSIGHAPIIENMPQNYQMLNRLVPQTFSGGDDLTQVRFYAYYDLRNVVTDPGVDLREKNLPVVKDTMYHTIHAGEDSVLIVLK